MKHSGLAARIERLEAQRPQKLTRVHRLIVEKGEAEAEARKRYEQESGLEIGPDELVIVRVIVDPAIGMTA